MYTLDTNALIYYIAGDPSAKSLFFRLFGNNSGIIVPTIVVVEFFSFPRLTKQDDDLFSDLLPNFELFPLDFTTAKHAARLRKQYRISLADGVVAATALATNSQLITRNLRDFKKVEGLRVVNI